ncbi:hypothetical protein C1H46_010585 [Malus baccata]|uniref:GST N-terminal domain-containing protein n=1 Tax=Malus baccata TaxID=106549 RepID=A0A540MYB8_MALBA|nr:hypothetical protein C1H46_010585 [Malus baccata]
MATLKVSLSGTAAPTSSPSPSLKSWPHISDSPPKISVVARFPNATVLSPPKLRLQASLGKKTRASVSAAMATGRASVSAAMATGRASVSAAMATGRASVSAAMATGRASVSAAMATGRASVSAAMATGRASVSAAMATGGQEVLPPALTSTSDPPPIFDGNTRPVPSLEHNNEVKGESLDLIRYIDSHFEGPSLFPDDPAKKEFGEELLSYTDSFNRSVFSSVKQDEIDAYAPFLGRFQLSLMDLKKYDIAAGRPKLAAWIELDNTIASYTIRNENEKSIESHTANENRHGGDAAESQNGGQGEEFGGGFGLLLLLFLLMCQRRKQFVLVRVQLAVVPIGALMILRTHVGHKTTNTAGAGLGAGPTRGLSAIFEGTATSVAAAAGGGGGGEAFRESGG